MLKEVNVADDSADSFTVEVKRTDGHCPIGETVGKRNIEEGRIPVLSCEGGCIRGEIARLAANMVSKEAGFARGCHGRILEGLLGKDRLVQFDALKVYRKYTDIFDVDDVPEDERKKAAQQVADSVLVKLGHNRTERTLEKRGAKNANSS